MSEVTSDNGASAPVGIGEGIFLNLRIVQLEEKLNQALHRLSLAEAFDNAKFSRIKQLEAELADWSKLRVPRYLLEQLCIGVPAQLDVRDAQHLLVTLQVASEYDQ